MSQKSSVLRGNKSDYIVFALMTHLVLLQPPQIILNAVNID